MIIIFHASCADGFCAAWVAHKKYPNAFYASMQYGDKCPSFMGEDIMILDFSFKRDDLLNLKANNKSVVVLDHHKTAQRELEGLDFCKFDMNKSGGRLTWEYLFGDSVAPWQVDYTEDRDLWLWKLINSREVSAGLTLYNFDFEVWNNLHLNTIMDQGKIVLAYQSKLIDGLVSKAVMGSLGGYDVPFVNSPLFQSEIGEKLAENHMFAVIYFNTTEEKRVYSLRSKGDFDVSVIAKQFGGGGHKNAAGFTKP